MLTKEFFFLTGGLMLLGYFIPEGTPAWCWAIWYVFCFAAGLGLAWQNNKRIQESKQDGYDDEEY